jgi:hypothetical protein
MSEAALRVLQIGQESTYGTSVPATSIYPCEPGSGEFELDRSPESPDEDYGMLVRHQPTRGQWGVRTATGSINSMARFEDLGQILKSSFGPAVITGAGPYTYTYTPAVVSDAAVAQTIEVSEETQDWDCISALCTNFSVGFDAITVPGNFPWNMTSDWVAVDKEKSTATAALSAPAINETIEGQWTQLFDGTTATAFGSLAELAAHLIQFRFTGATPHPPRIYGSATGDKATARGVQKRELTFEMGLKISSSSITNIFDIFNVTGGLPTDRRMRIKATGSGAKTFTIDGRVRYQTVNVDPDMRDGERGLSVTGVYMYDSTLASDIQMVIAGIANATLP